MSTTPSSFGTLLRSLRKRVGMTQSDLAAAVGYSIAAISALEQERRLPAVEFVVQSLVPALALADAPQLATRLVELAAAARGERPPTVVTIQRATQVVIQEEVVEPPSCLPLLPTTLLGRAAHINHLCDRLLGHDGRLLTLVGPPGIGKTTLALAVAAQVQPHYRDGAVFVALAAISEPTLMASTIATAVGCSDASSKPPQIRLIEFLRRKTMLLVLDNLEQIPAAAPLIAELVAECPGVCVLATSRERLHLRAEKRFKVPPLDLAPAVELFVQRAQAVDGDFRPTPQNQPTLAAICQRLDCLPLAIELCAAQVDLFSPAQLLAQLQARPLDLLVDGAQDLPPQHRTLRAAIQRSYALLNADEQRLLRVVGGFVGGFALPEVAMVMAGRVATGEWKVNNDPIPQSLVATLHSLIGKSLVRSETTTTGEQRFLLLETIREFALEQVQIHGEEGALRQCHYAAYLHLFRIGDSHLRDSAATTWLARLKLEVDNLRAALQWALDEKRYADAEWLMMAAGWFWHLSGQFYESAQWREQVIPHRHLLPLNLQVEVLSGIHAVARTQAEYHPLAPWTDELIQALKGCSAKLLQASAWFWIAVWTIDFSQAIPRWEQALAFARAAYEEPGIGPEFCLLADYDFILVSCLWDYANVLIERGEIERAIPLFEESLAIFRRRKNEYEIADGLGMSGFLAFLQGNLAQAYDHLHEAVNIATAFNHQPMIATWQSFLGIVTLYRGDAATAYRLLMECLEICTQLKDLGFMVRTCIFLADMTLWVGDVEQAGHWLAQSFANSTDRGRVTMYEVARLFVAARLATRQQEYQRAATIFGLAEQAHSQINYVIGGPLREVADAALATVQAALEPVVFAEAFAAGQQMTLETAFATILSPTAGEKSRG